MHVELKALTPQPPTYRLDHHDYETLTTKDDRPLLKPDPAHQHHLPVQLQPSPARPDELSIKYPAFVRHDAYGTMGKAHLPLREKLLLCIALTTLVPIRIILGFLFLIVYYLVCRVCTIAKDPYVEEGEQEDYAHLGGVRRVVIFHTGKLLARVMLFLMGFYWIRESRREVFIDGEFNNRKVNIGGDSDRPAVIISNHVSYLDILYHMSRSFPSFVAKRSVGKLPFLGLISKCLGCVFVQREAKRSDFKGVSGVVNERIREAQQKSDAPTMMLFPEGTTTNGEFLLPFKTGAFLAKAPVLPVLLKFPYNRFSPAWDSISGVRHIFLLLCQFVNYLEVIRLPIYYPSQLEKDDPKLYAYNVRRCMAHEGNLVLSDIGLPEKRIYHAALNGGT